MSTPGKSPVPKSPSKKRKGGMSPIMLPGLDKLPKHKGGKPVVVVVVKGGKKPPNLSNLPFLIGGNKKRKKGSKVKKGSGKSGDKKKATKTGEDDSDVSDSDRVTAPDLPKARTQKVATSVRSDKSFTDVSSTTSTTSNTNMPLSRTPQLDGIRSSKGPISLPKQSESVIIQGGIIDRPCVPMFVLIDGPVGCPIIVPLDARDDSGLVPEGGPQPLRTSPSQPTHGYLLVEDGLLHFKPAKDCPVPPSNSTSGTLTKFLSSSNIFIADNGPKLPVEKEVNYAPSATIQEKIGVRMAVSGFITILADKGTCKFTRVSAVTKAPFYPENAAMGVLVKDRSSSFLYWIPTENRFVGPLLSQNVKVPVKTTKEMTITGNVYKDSSGIITFENPSNKLDNLIGFIMSSATGVPIYAAKPEGVITTTTRSKSAAVSSTVPAVPSPPPVPKETTQPVSSSSPPQQPQSRDEISPPPVLSSTLPPPPPVAAVSPSSPPVDKSASPPSTPAPSTPSLGWSLLSSLGSVLTTTATVISTTAGAVTEAAQGAGASLAAASQQMQPLPTATLPPSSVSSSTVPVPSPPPVPSTVSTPTPTKVVAAPKSIQTVPVPVPAPPRTKDTSDEEAALAAEEAAAARVADAASNGGKTGVSINITVRDSGSNGGKISDQRSDTGRSDGESFSDASSEGGIGEQMASIYRNLLSSQNELPPEPEQREEESKNEEKVERKARPSTSEETRRKAETSKEYKKYKEDRSVYFSPYGGYR